MAINFSRLNFYINRTLIYKDSWRGLAIRAVIKRFHFMPYEMRVMHSLIKRPQYGLCLLNAANLAKKLGHTRVSVLEFGVAGGRGLIDLEMHAAKIRKLVGIDVEIYGFDTGTGMPAPQDYRDLPFFLRGGEFVMDVEKLKSRLKLQSLF